MKSTKVFIILCVIIMTLHLVVAQRATANSTQVVSLATSGFTTPARSDNRIVAGNNMSVSDMLISSTPSTVNDDVDDDNDEDGDDDYEDEYDSEPSSSDEDGSDTEEYEN